MIEAFAVSGHLGTRCGFATALQSNKHDDIWPPFRWLPLLLSGVNQLGRERHKGMRGEGLGRGGRGRGKGRGRAGDAWGERHGGTGERGKLRTIQFHDASDVKQPLYTQLTSLTHGVTQRQTLTRQSSLNTACWMILLLFTPAGISSRLTALRIFLRNVPTSFTLTSASRRAAQISFSISSNTCDSEGRRER